MNNWVNFGFIMVMLYMGFAIGVSYSNVNLTELEFVETVAHKFADTHEYNRTSYNCKNYSADFEFVMESLGYDVGRKRGVGKAGAHMWNTLVLDVEAINGEVVFDHYEGTYPERRWVVGELNEP